MSNPVTGARKRQLTPWGGSGGARRTCRLDVALAVMGRKSNLLVLFHEAPTSSVAACA